MAWVSRRTFFSQDNKSGDRVGFDSDSQAWLGLPGGSVVNTSLSVQETWIRSLDWDDLMKKEMATHSSVLTWDIPWTGEPGKLQSTRSQRAGHDWATKQQQQITQPFLDTREAKKTSSVGKTKLRTDLIIASLRLCHSYTTKRKNQASIASIAGSFLVSTVISWKRRIWVRILRSSY